MSAIRLTGLHKRFGATHTLRGIDLDIAEGEFVVFVGPSGCGKSTLLRLISGLEGASEGAIRIGGQDVTALPASRRGVAMVFQSYALYPHMTVRQNLAFGMAMRGVPKATIAAKLERAVAMLKLGPYLERRPGELSGGQCQRVAIGRALVQEPQVFLFDEPLSNLDAELRLHMRLEIAALHREIGRTMVYVTHDQVEAMTLADRIVVLRDGRIEQIGTPMELYERPGNTFVAGFIGAPPMNLLPASAVASLPMPPGAATLGVRPEHLRPAAQGPLSMRLSAIERLGASTVLHGELTAPNGSAAPAPAAIAVELRSVDAPPVERGARLTLEPVAGCLHAFDADGRRL
jgi:ABC-type sugar transport system ATPase subunit